MGHQESCAKVGGVCLDSEIRTDEARERSHGDSERNLTCAFVDDAHIRVAYSESGALGWTRESAREYARQLLVYPKPLYMVAEPEADMYEFLETHTYSQGICVHKNRPWCTHSYTVAGYGGHAFRAMEVQKACALFIRIFDNTTPKCLAVAAMAAKARELRFGANPRIPKSVVADALHKFGRVARVKEFYACMKGILRCMCLG